MGRYYFNNFKDGVRQVDGCALYRCPNSLFLLDASFLTWIFLTA